MRVVNGTQQHTRACMRARAQQAHTLPAHALQLSTSGELPLHGRRILVTAPRQYASKLTAMLVQAGGRPLWVPGVAVERLGDPQHELQLDAALANLRSYSHIAFTSRNGITAVLERLATLHDGDAAAAAAYVRGTGVRLCALGADGDVLQAAGLPVHLSPAEPSTAGMVAALAAAGEAGGARVLCPVPNVTGGLQEPAVVPRFLQALTAAGAAPERVPAYDTRPGLVGPAACVAEATLLVQGYFDAIAFSSTAEAQGLCLLMGGADAVQAAVAQHGTLLAAHGPYTAAGVGEVLGTPVTVVSRAFGSFHGLVDALGAALGPNLEYA